MKTGKTSAIVALLASLPTALWAGDIEGVASFSKQIPGTDRRISVTTATFADKIYFEYRISAEDGEMQIQVTIYDGAGREVYAGQSMVLVRAQRGGGAVLYGFRRDLDAPGVWWYVAAIDNKVIASSSLQVDAERK